MKKFDYRKKMRQNQKRYKNRVAKTALAVSIAIGTPAAYTTMSDAPLQESLGIMEVQAATDNLMGQDDHAFVNTVYYDEYEVTNYPLNDTANGVEINRNDYDELTYAVKFTEELSYILEDSEFESGLTDGYNQDSFMVSGSYVDEDGKDGTVARDELNPTDFVSINHETNSVEFDMYSFLEENGFESLSNFSFTMPIFQDGEYPIEKGDYTLQTALVAEGSGVDLNSVDGADQINFTLDEGADPEDGDSDEGEDNDSEDEEDSDDENSDTDDGDDGSPQITGNLNASET